MIKKTRLYQMHVEAGGKMVDFAGWSLPIHYGSQLKEHSAVRQDSGVFDVSHMTIIDCIGPGAEQFLRRVIANDVGTLNVNQCLYGLLLNERGGVIDDLIVYRLSDKYRLVTNAATRERVLDWLALQNLEKVELEEQNLVMLAIQGPQAQSHLVKWDSSVDLGSLSPFYCLPSEKGLIARTGYTGEDGFEVMLPEDEAPALWRLLVKGGVEPAGLGARDTLRLEAGLNLYGQDMDEETSPLIANISWTVKWNPVERDFIGRSALEPMRKNFDQKLVGLVLDGKGILRQNQKVASEFGEGRVTSGSYSPTMARSIALARVPKKAEAQCQVEIRGKLVSATIVKPPFVKNGGVLVDLYN